jgi:hypothetical protein
MAIEEFLKVVDEERCFDDLARITLFDRIQLSNDLEKAIDWVIERLNEDGIEAKKEVITHDGWIEGHKVPRGWEGRGAIYVKEERIENRLIRRSSTLESDIYNLVVLKDGTSPEDYSNLNVNGKMVISDRDPIRVAELACGKFGAAGVISDWLPEYCDDFSAIAYKSFFENEKSGFVVSRKVGRKLRKENRVECCIDGKFHHRKIPVGVAEIGEGKSEGKGKGEGEGKNEVVGVAHICHPKHEANDNASGAASLMEVTRALANKKLKRKIRMLWVPEILGTIAYFSKHRVNAVAGLNLDMVGEDQFLCKSPLLIEHPPFFLDPHSTDVLLSILEKVKTKQGAVHSFGGDFSYPLYMAYSTPFSGGSDHLVLADLGIATPMIIHWPDRYYHTSKDTLDKVSKEELKRVGVLASEYFYRMANSKRKPKRIELRTDKSKGKVYKRKYKQPLFKLKDREYSWKNRKFLSSSTSYLAIMLVDGSRSVNEICSILSSNRMKPKKVPEFFEVLYKEGILELIG